MRWFSSVVILVYLSLLCSPHALALHDSRLSPLADTQLQGLNPVVHSVFNQNNITPDDTDQDPADGIVGPGKTSSYGVERNIRRAVVWGLLSVVVNAHPPRAPPFFSSR